MTDKQIIIDNIDVSKCEHFEDEECLNPSETVANCEASPNCYYKQLKRLEKLLPDINGKFYKAMDDLKAKEKECERLRFPMQDTNYAILAKEEFEEYKKLKAENDLLRKTHKTEQDRRRAYENALAEIKEIADIINDRTMVASYICDHLDKILQKISEVENDNA